MSRDNIEVNYHYNNKELAEIINKLVELEASIDKKELEKDFEPSYKEVHLFSRIVKCNDCSGNMSYRKRYKGYKCINSQRKKGLCTSHSIKEEYLLELIKESLKDYSDEKIRWAESYKTKNKKYAIAESYRKELKKIEKELEEIENQFEGVYFRNVNGDISYRNFENIMRALQKKQQFLIMKKGNVECLILKNENEGRACYERYRENVDKVLEFRDVDMNIIEILINKITVSENKSLNKKTVDVYYKFKKV